MLKIKIQKNIGQLLVKQYKNSFLQQSNVEYMIVFPNTIFLYNDSYREFYSRLIFGGESITGYHYYMNNIEYKLVYNIPNLYKSLLFKISEFGENIFYA